MAIFLTTLKSQNLPIFQIFTEYNGSSLDFSMSISWLWLFFQMKFFLIWRNPFFAKNCWVVWISNSECRSWYCTYFLPATTIAKTSQPFLTCQWQFGPSGYTSANLKGLSPSMFGHHWQWKTKNELVQNIAISFYYLKIYCSLAYSGHIW